MDWSTEDVLEFLECYKNEPCIWNPQHPDHKQRNKVADAWERVHDKLNFNCNLNELKRKKESLMASFRCHLNRIRKCMDAGKTSEEVPKPCWFAFEPMDKFLGPLYMNSSNAGANFSHFLMDADDQSNLSDTGAIKPNDNEVENQESKSSTNKNHTPYRMEPLRKRKAIEKNIEIDESEKRMEQALYHVLKDGTTKDPEKDECDLYGALLAKKLRKFDDMERDELMLEIDTFLLRKRRKLPEVVLIS